MPLVNYLSDRIQYGYIDGLMYILLPVICSVPQGAIIGPLIFVKYINVNICENLIIF